MSNRLIRIAAIGAVSIAAAGCSSFPSTNNLGLAASDAQHVRDICANLMGLRAGGEFEACTGSLASSVSHLQQASLVAQADQACVEQGHARGSADLATCVIKTRHDAAKAPAPSLLVSNVTTAEPAALADSTSPAKYYAHMSPSERGQSAELSCAQIGLHPAWGGFNQCVTDLQQSIVDVRYQMPN